MCVCMCVCVPGFSFHLDGCVCVYFSPNSLIRSFWVHGL
jgi:hypothetical protein